MIPKNSNITPSQSQGIAGLGHSNNPFRKGDLQSDTSPRTKGATGPSVAKNFRESIPTLRSKGLKNGRLIFLVCALSKSDPNKTVAIGILGRT